MIIEVKDRSELKRLTDSQLMRRVIDNDQWAMHELYKRQYRFVLGVLKIQSNQISDLDHCYNNIMLEVWRKAEQYNPNRNFRAWLYRLCRRQACRAINQALAMEKAKNINSGHDEATISAGDSRSLYAQVNQAIQALPRRQRHLMQLYIATGSLQQAAEVLAMDPEKAGQLYREARKKLHSMDQNILKMASLL